MKNPPETIQGLIAENSILKQRIWDLEQSESGRQKAEEALRNSETRWRLSIDNMLEAYALHEAIFDRNGRMVDYRFLEFNPAAQKISNIAREEIVGRTALELYPHIVERGLMDRYADVIATGAPAIIEDFYYAGDNLDKVFDISCFRIDNRHFVCVFREITARKRAEEELRRNRDILERLAQEAAILAEVGKVISSTLDTVEVFEKFATEVRKLIPFDRLSVNLHDLDHGIVTPIYVSGMYIAGRQPGDSFPLKGSISEVLVTTRAGMFSSPLSLEETDKRFPDHVSTIKTGMQSLLSVPLISRDEVIASLHFRSRKPNMYTEENLRLAERIGEQIAGAIVNAQLYAGLKKAEQKLKESEQRYRELSIIDGLTQLNNSRHFYFQLKIELDRSNRYEQPLTLLLLDLDNFKSFNDTYGHVEGDQVLMRLGQVIKRCLRETDFAYRYGGEEFTILLPMTTSTDAAVTAERIRIEFKKEAFSPLPGHDVHMTVSIGLAQYRQQEEIKAFVHRVDQLMYQGKKNGKDRVCSESSSQAQIKG